MPKVGFVEKMDIGKNLKNGVIAGVLCGIGNRFTLVGGIVASLIAAGLVDEDVSNIVAINGIQDAITAAIAGL